MKNLLRAIAFILFGGAFAVLAWQMIPRGNPLEAPTLMDLIDDQMGC